MTLNNLGVLYSDTQRMKESEQSFQEALATYRRLAEANPEEYLPKVAMTLNNLGDSIQRHAANEGSRTVLPGGAHDPPTLV